MSTTEMMREWAARYASTEPSPDVDRPNRTGGRYSRDELMYEWDHFRGIVPFKAFHLRLDMNYKAWEQAFARAARAGDPRAVRGRYDRAGVWDD